MARRFLFVGGSLPPGMSFDTTTGTVFGQPTATGLYAFSLRSIDSFMQAPSKAFILRVNSPMQIQRRILASANGEGTTYSDQVMLLSGAPPSGITWNASTGTSSGTTTGSIGQFSAVVQAGDSVNQAASSTILFNFTERGPAPRSLPPSALPNGTVGVPYNFGVGASGGTSPYALRISPGSWPTGLVLNCDGSFLGTPSLAGTFGIEVSDRTGRSAEQLDTVPIAPPTIPSLSITTESVPSGVIGQPYAASFGASGGRAPYAFSASGDLPPGVVFTSNAALAGTPTAAGTFRFTVSVTDSLSACASRAFSITIVGLVEITTSSPLPDSTAGQPFAPTFAATGGTPPYTFAFTGLPAGLTGNSSGAVTGIPTASGLFSFSVEAMDTRGLKSRKGFSVQIFARLEITSSPATAPVPLNQPLGGGFAAVGGKPPYSWAVSSGTLPSGVAFDSVTGQLSRAPTTPGIFSFAATVTDALRNTATGSATIRVLAPVSITTTSLPGRYGLRRQRRRHGGPSTLRLLDRAGFPAGQRRARRRWIHRRYPHRSWHLPDDSNRSAGPHHDPARIALSGPDHRHPHARVHSELGQSSRRPRRAVDERWSHDHIHHPDRADRRPVLDQPPPADNPRPGRRSR